MLLFLICLALIFLVSLGISKLPIFTEQPSRLGKTALSFLSTIFALFVGIISYGIILDFIGLKITGIPQVIGASLVVGLPLAFKNFSSVTRRVTNIEGGTKSTTKIKTMVHSGLIRIWIFVSFISIVGFGIELGIDTTRRDKIRDYQIFTLKQIMDRQTKIDHDSKNLNLLRSRILETAIKKHKIPEDLQQEFEWTRSNINDNKQLIKDLEESRINMSSGLEERTTRIGYGKILIWAIPLGLGVLLLGINWIAAGFRKSPHEFQGARDAEVPDTKM